MKTFKASYIPDKNRPEITKEVTIITIFRIFEATYAVFIDVDGRLKEATIDCFVECKWEE